MIHLDSGAVVQVRGRDYWAVCEEAALLARQPTWFDVVVALDLSIGRFVLPLQVLQIVFDLLAQNRIMGFGLRALKRSPRCRSSIILMRLG